MAHDITILTPADGAFDVAELDRICRHHGLSPDARGAYKRDGQHAAMHVAWIELAAHEMTFDLSFDRDALNVFREIAEDVLARYRCKAHAHRETHDNHDPLADDELAAWAAPVSAEAMFPDVVDRTRCTVVELLAEFGCRAVMGSWTVSPREACARLAKVLNRAVTHRDASITVEVVEPVEVAALARALVPQADRSAGFALRAFVASAAALDLMRGETAPAGWAWPWLREQLDLRDDPPGALAATVEGGYADLDRDGRAPLLVLADRRPRRREPRVDILEGDDVVEGVAFTRDASGAWLAEGRRLRTGDRVARGDLEVIAIL